jgi:hypothetical protein
MGAKGSRPWNKEEEEGVFIRFSNSFGSRQDFSFYPKNGLDANLYRFRQMVPVLADIHVNAGLSHVYVSYNGNEVAGYLAKLALYQEKWPSELRKLNLVFHIFDYGGSLKETEKQEIKNYYEEAIKLIPEESRPRISVAFT